MPYASFTAITDDDMGALYAYFMNEVKPVKQKPPETRLPFPFNVRWSLIFWDAAFVKHERYKPRADRDAQWNRGACHTPRGLGFQEQAYDESWPVYLSGARVDNWFTGNLRGDFASGLGRWSEADIAAFLETGHGDHRISAFGSMIEVIENSTQYWHKDDLNALAHYLKLLSPRGEKVAYEPDTQVSASALSAMLTGATERPGVGIYQAFCVKCHKVTGEGEAGKFSRHAGNSSVLSETPASLIRLLLQGRKGAQTKARPKPKEMPGFAGDDASSVVIAGRIAKKNLNRFLNNRTL